MSRYRTEIRIATDRYVCLQLPPHFPEGRAVITVHSPEPGEPDPDDATSALDFDHDDIEWWDEFDETDPVE